MSTELAFVGDIHGNLTALEGMWDALHKRQVAHVVFLGDYINKGPKSAQVMSRLLSHEESGRATLLAGNHETTLVDALERQDLSGFLKIGGASTIRSYVGGPVGPNVLQDFLKSTPLDHIQAFRRMPLTYAAPGLLAQHVAPRSRASDIFAISAHVPTGTLPRIGKHSAELDTGCGTPAGRLTALVWPTLHYIQVDNLGVRVRD
ncbi:metallophosphoesterase [Serinicoccus sediminis]|uniref:metallophosphoesterase n=1 Tax=Serinicoccus sediminis TaxID=2306021 RepID=UPI001020C117|nr:metallophosphoesterase [Serinicoccus sediminis]